MSSVPLDFLFQYTIALHYSLVCYIPPFLASNNYWVSRIYQVESKFLYNGAFINYFYFIILKVGKIPSQGVPCFNIWTTPSIVKNESQLLGTGWRMMKASSELEENTPMILMRKERKPGSGLISGNLSAGLKLGYRNFTKPHLSYRLGLLWVDESERLHEFVIWFICD